MESFILNVLHVYACRFGFPLHSFFSLLQFFHQVSCWEKSVKYMYLKLYVNILLKTVITQVLIKITAKIFWHLNASFSWGPSRLKASLNLSISYLSGFKYVVSYLKLWQHRNSFTVLILLDLTSSFDTADMMFLRTALERHCSCLVLVLSNRSMIKVK